VVLYTILGGGHSWPGGKLAGRPHHQQHRRDQSDVGVLPWAPPSAPRWQLQAGLRSVPFGAAPFDQTSIPARCRPPPGPGRW